MKKTFSPMNPLARDVEWPLYISTFSNFIKNQCLFFNSLPCLGYDIFEMNAHFTPLTPGMLEIAWTEFHVAK